MKTQNFSLVVALIFSVIAGLHVLRLAFGWEAVIGYVIVPFWASWFAVLIAGYLAIQAWKLSRKIRK